MQKIANCGLHRTVMSFDQPAYIPLRAYENAGHTHLRKIWKVMRLTAILLTAAFIHMYASSSGQNVTVAGNDLTLKQVFTAIEKQTGYVLFYKKDFLTDTKRVSLSAYNMPVREFLDIVLKNEPIDYTIQDKTIVLSRKPRAAPSSYPVTPAYRPDPPIRILVTDTSGSPLPRASVSVKSSRITGATDSEGLLSLNAAENDILTVSYIGMETRTIRVTSDMLRNSMLTVILRPSIAKLNEVEVTVNTGYQKLPKERATGSFEVIDRVTLDQQVGKDILSRLEGVASGLIVDRNASASPQIRIRGLSTIAGPKDVLIVVDNFPYEGDIENINPNDVENITILRDAAAASIWGARAGNGVIVITTKKGKKNQPLQVDLNINYRIGMKPDLSRVQELLNSSDFVDVEKFLYDKGYYNNELNSSARPVISPVVDLLHKRKTATAQEQEEIDRMIDAYRQIDVRDEYTKYMYRPSFNQQYALSLSGGTQSMSWFSSIGYDREVTNTGAAANRLNLNFQNKYNPVKNLEITSGIYYTQRDNKNGRPEFGALKSKNNFILPYTPFADEAGNPVKMVKAYNANYLDTVGGGKLLDWSYYPLEDYKHESLQSKVYDATLNAGLRYSFLNGFVLDVKYLYQRQHTERKNIYDEQSFLARNEVNAWTQIKPDGSVFYAVPKGGVLDESNSTMIANNIRGQLNYDGQWGKHSLTAIAGGEIRMIKQNGVANRFYGYNDKVLTFGLVDYTNMYPMFVAGNLSYILNRDQISASRHNYISGFANAAYTYNNRYTVSLSARQDASNLFGLNVNDQWNPFWSAGLKWDVSNEPFFQSEVIDALHMRATYGFSGNVNPAMVTVTTLSYFSNLLPETNSKQARFSNFYNPELRWETSNMLNLGVDFSFFHNKISGAVEYYRKRGENLFGPELLDYTAGVGSTITKNVASMIGTGVDLTLKTINISTRSFEWRSSLQYSHNKERVLNYYLADRRGSLFVGSVSRVAGIVGKPVYSVFGYQWAGLDPQNGDPVGYVAGEPSKDYSAIRGVSTTIDDLQYFGSALPTHFGSLVNTFSYKGISLGFSLVYKLGYYFRKESINYSSLYSSWRGHADYSARWQQPGDEQFTNVPSQIYPAVSNRDFFYEGSEVLVDKADQIRLQYVNLSYTLPAGLLNGKLKNLRNPQFYLNATNLGLIWKANRFGLDPDRMSLYQVRQPLVLAFGFRTGF